MAQQQYSFDSQRLLNIEEAWGKSTLFGATVAGTTIH
jgi:hypothetical protein